MNIIMKINEDITKEELGVFKKQGYVCVDTETTGVNYLTDQLCTIQLFCEGYGILIKYHSEQRYTNLVELFYAKDILKIFHNAVFDVSFLMKNLRMSHFGELVCTRIASKLVNGIEHNNSLKPLLKEYLEVGIDKKQQTSDWSQEKLNPEQIEYAMNDVIYLNALWNKLQLQLEKKGILELAQECYRFIPKYKELSDLGIENIFTY